MSDRLADRRDAGIIGLALAFILCLVFAPFLFGRSSLMSSAVEVPSIYATGAVAGGHLTPPRTLDPGAPGWVVEPWLKITQRIMYGERRLPFWDNLDGYGKPYIGALEPQPFYPPTTLLALHPTPRTYAWWIAFRLFLAGFFAALFVRLFVPDRWAAIAGGAATMLTGYYLLYYDMPHLSVDVGFPMLLWATELIVRKRSPRRIAALAVAAALIDLGGMPESAFLALLVAVLYAVLRIFTTPGAWLTKAAAVAGGHVLGFTLGAIEVVPFLEYLPRAFSTHDARYARGFAYDGGWQNGLLGEFFPRAFGAPWNSILSNGNGFSGVRGFFGVTVFLLALIAVIAAWRRRSLLTPAVTILAAIVAYGILKRYGNPAVAWMGYLPLIRQVDFPKYFEFIVGDSIGILAGFGLAALRAHAAGRRAVVIAFGLTLALVSYLYLTTVAQLPVSPLASQYWRALWIGMSAFVAMGIAAYALTRDARRVRIAGTAAAVLLIVAEPFGSFIVPTTWHGRPPITDNPYAGTPYLTYLAQHVQRNNERIFAVRGMLFPNWAGAYGFADPRSLDGVYIPQYLPFVDAFLAPGAPAASDDLFDRFTGTHELDVNSPLFRRFLTLSSVGYYIEPDVRDMLISPRASVLDALWAQMKTEVPDGDLAVRRAGETLAGVSERTLFEHPPHVLTANVTVPRDRPGFVADLGLDPGSYSGPAVCGGPVTYVLEAFDGTKPVGSAKRTIDPKHDLAQRRWLPLSLDLRPMAGRTVRLQFSTQAVDTCAAWSVWGEPRFERAGSTAPLAASTLRNPPVFHAPGVEIYRIPHSLARMTLFHRARGVATLHDALEAITAPGFDERHEVVVTGAPPPLEPARGVDRVTITASRSDETTAVVDAASAGLLMQNDSWYPGWKASVDGADVPIYETDGLFRGVPVPAGHHTITIAYESPVALLGTLLSAASLVLLAFLLSSPVWLHRRAKTAEPAP